LAHQVRSGQKTVLTPLKWDVCFTPESRRSVSYAADCVDDEIIGSRAAMLTFHG